MTKFISILLMTLSLVACSSSQISQNQNSETLPDKVLARIDDLSSRPDWLKEGQAFEVKKGSLVSLGQVTIPGDSRVEAAYLIAENNAKGAICNSIETRLDFILQQAEEGTSIDSTQVRRIGAEACKITTSSLRPGNRYWEKIATSTDSGERVTRYKVFATVTMPENDFKRAIMESIKRQSGKVGISESFSKKVDQHWDQFMEKKDEHP